MLISQSLTLYQSSFYLFLSEKKPNILRVSFSLKRKVYENLTQFNYNYKHLSKDDHDFDTKHVSASRLQLLVVYMFV